LPGRTAGKSAHIQTRPRSKRSTLRPAKTTYLRMISPAER